MKLTIYFKFLLSLVSASRGHTFYKAISSDQVDIQSNFSTLKTVKARSLLHCTSILESTYGEDWLIGFKYNQGNCVIGKLLRQDVELIRTSNGTAFGHDEEAIFLCKNCPVTELTKDRFVISFPGNNLNDIIEITDVSEGQVTTCRSIPAFSASEAFTMRYKDSFVTCGGSLRDQCKQFNMTDESITNYPHSLLQPRTSVLWVGEMSTDEYWIAGGSEDFNGAVITGTEFFRNGIFEPGPTHPDTLIFTCSLFLGGSLITIGGLRTNHTSISGTTIDVVHEYNIVTDSWSTNTIPSLQQERSMHACGKTSDGNGNIRLIVAGGHDGAKSIASVEIFDMSQMTWTYGQELPNLMSKHAPAQFSDYFMFTGGHILGSGTHFSDMFNCTYDAGCFRVSTSAIAKRDGHSSHALVGSDFFSRCH